MNRAKEFTVVGSVYFNKSSGFYLYQEFTYEKKKKRVANYETIIADELPFLGVRWN